MSILAWRLFLLTLIARTHPAAPGTTLLTDNDWKVLYGKGNHPSALPAKTPSLRAVVIWMARLGGFLARKWDGQPGTITLWRGWKRLTDFTQGWLLAAGGEICG
jgi:Transposase Tn5 dimerisation domain